MTTGYVIFDEGDATGWHVEAIKRIAACGRRFDLSRGDVRRELYGRGEAVDKDHPHATFCFDCAGRHGVIRPPEGGASA
jgi:hypothetical protein